ncbi:MAG: hypothetical protein ACXVZU_05840 [Methanobacteriaceae archaeon]
MEFLALIGSPRTYDYLGMKFTGKILAKAYEREEIKKDQKPLKKAFQFGASL